MDPATLLLITQILALATQAAAQIPAIKSAFAANSGTTASEQQAQAQAQLAQAHTNLQTVIQHAQAALNGTTSTSAA